MKRRTRRPYWLPLGASGLLLAAVSCSLDKVEIPELSGAAGLSHSLELTAVPDLVTANGYSTSAIRVVLRGPDGQPVPGRGIFFALASENGLFVDRGRLSADRATTNGEGIAQVIYTSPPRTDFTGNQNVRVTARTIGSDATGQQHSSVQITLRSAEPRLFPQDPSNEAPTCNFVMEPALGPYFANRDVLFQTTSSDADGTIVRYDWDFGDGYREDKPDVVHRYAFPGNYTIVHVVTDDDGLQDACGIGILVQ